ncbi:MAG: glycosyltransferase family 9 protein [Bryobacteraceae bacterium]
MQALLVLHGGVGDIVRCSCLARVLTGLGYTVDLLIVPHYPSAIALYENHPEVRHVYSHPHPFGKPFTPHYEPIRDITYDLAIIKLRRTELKNLIRAHRRIWSSVDAPNRGDAEFCLRVAAKLGWNAPLPNSFVRDSGRHFDLPAGTVAMHPGCHPNRHFKKWHGYAELTRHFPHVAIVGSCDDLYTETTYFQSAFEWPPHVTDFTPLNLDLPDTASLLKQCRMMISNDSGLMHLSVAAGTPTYGIFGITSPHRELMPFPHMRAVTKRLPCEPACWLRPYDTDCEYHLQCLKTLTPQEVLYQIESGAAHTRSAAQSIVAAGS